MKKYDSKMREYDFTRREYDFSERKYKMRKGFTLIELAISMVFVGILSLAVALIINDTVASYRRGLTLNQINTTGMDLVDDMRTAVQNSSSRSVLNDCFRYYAVNGATTSRLQAKCLEDGAYSFVYLVKTSMVSVNGAAPKEMPIYGAFCTGTYSYIWNTGYYESDDAQFSEKTGRRWATLAYMDADGNTQRVEYTTRLKSDGVTADTDRPFRLLKVRDDYRGVCTSASRSYNGSTYENEYKTNAEIMASFSGEFSMVGYGQVSYEDAPVDIIMTDKTYDLAIYDLAVPQPAESTTQKNSFYSVSFILGTVGGGINILANGKSCAAPNDYAIENFDYCAINRFSFAMQAGGR